MKLKYFDGGDELDIANHLDFMAEEVGAADAVTLRDAAIDIRWMVSKLLKIKKVTE